MTSQRGDGGVPGVSVWLKLVLRRAPFETLTVFGLSSVTTVVKLVSIITGVVAIQTQLTDRSLGGPWAVLTALPISGSGAWLLVSFVTAVTAVMTERATQGLRNRAAETTCVGWLHDALQRGGSPDRSLADVGRIARTLIASLLWGSAVAEMVIVLLGLGVVHPLAGLVALAALPVYALVEMRRGHHEAPDTALASQRNQLVGLYSQLLSSLPGQSSAHALVLEHASTESRILAPARAYLTDQRSRLRQSSEAPLVLAVLIGALYLLAVFEGSDDPVGGAASLAISFLLIRILVGSSIRLSRAAATVQVLWAGREETSPDIGALAAAIDEAPGTVAVFGVDVPTTRAAVEDLVGNDHVITLTHTAPVTVGLSVAELGREVGDVGAVADLLHIDLHDARDADVGEAGLEARLALLLASLSPAETALVVAVTAWLDLPDEVRETVTAVLQRVVLVHPTARSGVPDLVDTVVLMAGVDDVEFHGDVASYLAARPWERPRGQADASAAAAEVDDDD